MLNFLTSFNVLLGKEVVEWTRLDFFGSYLDQAQKESRDEAQAWNHSNITFDLKVGEYMSLIIFKHSLV